MKILLIVLITLAVSPANATIVTEQWKVLTERPFVLRDGSVLNQGSLLDWTIRYDNQSLEMYRYNDGLNNIAEFGLSDDSIASTWAITESGPYQKNSFLLFSNATIEFGVVLTELIALYNTNSHDFYDYNESRRYISSGGDSYVYTADNIQLESYANRTTYMIFYYDTYISKVIGGELSSVSIVPVPPSLVLFCSGLIVSLHWKRKFRKSV